MYKTFQPFSVALVMMAVILIASTAWAGDTIYHPNGQVAWYGSKGGTVYHANGQVAWYGSEGGTVYHANGQVAWYGNKGGTCYHSNGNVFSYSCDGVTIFIGPGLFLTVTTKYAYLSLYGIVLIHTSSF